MKTGIAAALALATLALATLAPASALAVESGTGAYLLGTRGMAAGSVPGPGVYISDSIIYLQSRTRQDISIGGAIVADPSIAALVNLAAVTVVPDMPAFGGTAALSVVVPYAGVDMDFSGRFLAARKARPSTTARTGSATSPSPRRSAGTTATGTTAARSPSSCPRASTAPPRSSRARASSTSSASARTSSRSTPRWPSPGSTRTSGSR